MATWDPEAQLSHPRDYRLARNTFVTLFWDPQVLRETTEWLLEQGYDVRTVDASPWTDELEMHKGLASLLDFPDYYGHNRPALADCLSDVAAGDYGVNELATGLVLVVQNYDTFAARDPDAAFALLDIFAVQARGAALIGRRMLCLLQSNDPRLTFPPVGAVPVMWNDAEWLDSKRGL